MKRTDITNLFPEATDEQVKALMDINGADINRVKEQLKEATSQLAEATSQLEAMKNSNTEEELAHERERAQKLADELNGIKTAEKIRGIREKVSKELNVPADLLTAETEEDCTAQANAILSFARPAGYPQVRDGGEVSKTGNLSTRQQFADWFNGQ